jgi:hypothetical protein
VIKSLAYFSLLLIVLLTSSACEKDFFSPRSSSIPYGHYEFSLELDGYFGFFCVYERDENGDPSDCIITSLRDTFPNFPLQITIEHNTATISGLMRRADRPDLLSTFDATISGDTVQLDFNADIEGFGTPSLCNNTTGTFIFKRDSLFVSYKSDFTDHYNGAFGALPERSNFTGKGVRTN